MFLGRRLADDLDLQLDLERLQAAWQEAVFALYLAEEKIEPEVVENMRTWPHSGFSVDQSVFLPAGDRAGIERLVGYMTRCPFSLSRLVKLTASGQVVYKAEKDACRAFPDPPTVPITGIPNAAARCRPSASSIRTQAAACSIARTIACDSPDPRSFRSSVTIATFWGAATSIQPSTTA